MAVFIFIFRRFRRPVGSAQIDEDNVAADLLDLLEIDKHIVTARFEPAEAFAPGHDDAEYYPLGITHDEVAHPAEAAPVRHIDHFAFSEFTVRNFHTIQYAKDPGDMLRRVKLVRENRAENSARPRYSIQLFIDFSAVFSSRETCACEMPTSSEISVCVFPS